MQTFCWNTVKSARASVFWLQIVKTLVKGRTRFFQSNGKNWSSERFKCKFLAKIMWSFVFLRMARGFFILFQLMSNFWKFPAILVRIEDKGFSLNLQKMTQLAIGMLISSSNRVVWSSWWWQTHVPMLLQFWTGNFWKFVVRKSRRKFKVFHSIDQNWTKAIRMPIICWNKVAYQISEEWQILDKCLVRKLRNKEMVF